MRAPLATAVTPRGTEMVKVYVALSLGWSLQGIQVRAPSGSLRTYEPPVVLNQPFGSPMAELRSAVAARYATSMRISSPALAGSGRVMRNSGPSVTARAVRPSTVTSEVARPMASSVISVRSVVSAASRPTMPSMVSVMLSYDRSTS